MRFVQSLKKIFFYLLTSLFLGKVHADLNPVNVDSSIMHVKAIDFSEPPFLQGEWLEYQVYYSFIHAGTATMFVDNELHKMNDHTCYKVQVDGTSSNALSMLGLKVADRWESYLDVGATHGLRPHRALTHLQENGYVRKEQVDFDYQSSQARIEVAESSRDMEPEVAAHPIPTGEVKDLVGGYYALRSIDTTKLKPGDKLTVTVFHDQQLYEDVAILFLGKKIINTKLGTTSTLVFAPLVPIEGSIFAGERPVEAYISDDANKVPLKLKVNLVVGAVEIELSNYKGLKEPIRFQPS